MVNPWTWLVSLFRGSRSGQQDPADLVAYGAIGADFPPIFISSSDVDRARSGGGPVTVYPAGMGRRALAGAVGLQETPPGGYSERGWTGVETSGGVLQNYDHNPSITPEDWRGTNARLGIIDEMVREDPVVAGVTTAWELAIRRGGGWTIEPPTGGAEDRRTLEITEHVRESYFEVLQGGFTAYIEQASTFVRRGTMLFEKVFALDRSGKVVLDKLAPRLPWTIDEWIREPDGRWAVKQCPPYGDDAWKRGVVDGPVIPADKLQHLVYQPDGNSPEGVSLFRPAHAGWRMRKLYRKLEGQGLQRAAYGIPVVTIKNTAAKGSERKVQEMLQELRAGARAYMTLPEGYELSFAEFPFKGDDLRESRVVEGKDIVRMALAMWIYTGDDSGAYNHILGQMDGFEAAVQTAADYIGDANSRGPHSAIHQLVDANFSGVTEYPRLVPGIVRVGDFARLINTLIQATGQRLVTPGEDLEDWTRKLLGAPEMPDETRAAWRQRVTTPGPTQDIRPPAEPAPADQDDDDVPTVEPEDENPAD